MAYCEKCGKTMKEKEFFMSRNTDKYPPDGRMPICKKCLTMHVDNWDPKTYLWILQEIDVPYVKDEWNAALEKYLDQPEKMSSVTVLGRYLAKMRMKQWESYRWKDTQIIEEKMRQERIYAMQKQGKSEAEIERELLIDRTPQKPSKLTKNSSQIEEDESDDIAAQLTKEDRIMLKLKWGKCYTPEEWVSIEQLYNDMMNSYDIQTAGHKDILIMVCKASLQANQLFDNGDK